jgi:hypothetical protein
MPLVYVRLASSAGSISATATLPQSEASKEQRSSGERDKGPGRPSVGAALNQRVDDRRQCNADEHHPADVETDARVRDSPRQHSDGAGERRDADRNVDEEYQSPPDPPQIGLHQRARQDRRSEDRETHHWSKGAEDLRHLFVVEDLLEHPEPLGNHQGPERTLEHAEGDQYRR